MNPHGVGCCCYCRGSAPPRPRRYSVIWRRAAAAGRIADSGDHGIASGAERGFFAGFVNDLRQLIAAGPERIRPRAVAAILKGGYPGTVRLKYERPDNRIADIEQFALLAARYDDLERLIADLLLAGDVYGMDTAAGDEPGEVLVLSTVHQAKGLEWSHIFIPRLVEESFPHRRAIDEPGGEDEERRIFYVAVSRAMNEFTLTYPLTIVRGGRGPTTFTMPSRFLTEIETGLIDTR